MANTCMLHNAIFAAAAPLGPLKCRESFLLITRLSWFGFIKLTDQAAEWSLGGSLQSREPTKDHSAPWSVSFMNPN